jgi:plasmid segregation protein ParM
VKEAFATHQILEVKEPMFANVRGYQIAGTNYAYTAMQAAARCRDANAKERAHDHGTTKEASPCACCSR